MQSDRQQAYDRGTTIFSPDGRLYQVEYAREAVARGSPTVGVTTDESVVFAAASTRRSPLVDPESIEKLHDVDGVVGMATAGHVADGRRLVSHGRQIAHREQYRYDEQPDVETVTKALADAVQEATQTGGTRPFGAALLVGGVIGEPTLYELDPSGTPSAWQATAIGGDSEAIKSVLEAEYEPGLDTQSGFGLAIESLESEDRELSPATLDLAVADEDGYTSLDSEETASLLSEFGS